MWSSFVRLLERALDLFFEYMGTNAIAVGLGLLVFFSMEAYECYRDGWQAATKHFKGSAGIGLLVTVLVWAGLFVFCVAKIVYDDHRSLVDANSRQFNMLQEKDQTINAQKKTIEELETQRQALESKLKERPKVIYREKHIPGVDTSEAARLRTELDQRERRKAIRSEITKFLDEAGKLRTAFISKEERRDLLPSVDEWNTKTREHLKSVEPSYAARFSTSSSASASGYVNVPVFNNNMINYLDARTTALSTILGELRD